MRGQNGEGLVYPEEFVKMACEFKVFSLLKKQFYDKFMLKYAHYIIDELNKVKNELSVQKHEELAAKMKGSLVERYMESIEAFFKSKKFIEAAEIK